ncbi:hypothetical protein ABPG75_003549 [Micractinium tetrahymenae]
MDPSSAGGSGAGPSRRPFKRQRVDAYPKGSIMKVEVHNFMTYKHAVIEPGPKLNLVLGPNGTGKSSLVCAISIGLGGRTTLLGRAEDLKDYVRRGDDVQTGWVEVTLSSGQPGRPYTVRREMSKADNHSTWRLNGREVPLKEVTELVRDKLKVQLDNLCQFLPQDKVVEFARMKPVDLLEATEKAIGNGELYDQHKALIEARKQLTEQDEHKDALDASLARLRAENERNTQDVKNIQRREAIMREAELAKQKLPWQQYEETRLKLVEDKQKLKEAKEHLARLQREAQEDEGPLAERQQRLAQLRAAKAKIEGDMRRVDARVAGTDGAGGSRGGQQQRGLEEEMNDAFDEVRAKEGAMQGLVAEAAKREQRIEQLAAQIAELEVAVAALPPPGDTGELGPQRQRLMREQQDVRTQASSFDMQLDELRTSREALQRQRAAADDRLRRIDDAKMRRLRGLDQRYPGISRAWQWLQQNRGRFRGSVYGPIAVEVECPDPFHMQCLEGQVAATTWNRFVTHFNEDQDLLNAEFKALGFQPAISNFTGNPDAPISHPRGEAGSFARYGISQTLDQVFTAPLLVKHMLCDEHGINESYIGGRNARVEDLFRDNAQIRSVWTPDANYRRTRSLYNAASESTLVGDLRPARLLTGGAQGDEGQECEALQAGIRHCEQELAVLARQEGELRGLKQAKDQQWQRIQGEMKQLADQITAMQRRHNDMRSRLKGKQSELERLRRSPDPRKKGPKLQAELEAAKKLGLEKALELARLQASQAERLVCWAEADLGIREANMQCELIKEASKQRQQQVERWQTNVNIMTQGCNQIREQCRRLKEAAEAAAPLTPELEAAFADLPASLAELQAFIDEKSAEADGMLIANPAALRQYNDRCRQIADQERQLAQVEERRQLARDTIDDLAGRWLPELKRIVARVNETFSANFQHVGCAGDVALHEAPGEDFAHYAIEIRVKFRDTEELQTLDANRQSGGERSVSTILYLIALQGVTVTPFRVVDEINQGMDPINERKVFMQLVDAACKDGTPQCFLLTPKLLPDLPYTQDVTVLQIMNGEQIRKVAERFSMDMLLGRKRMAALAAA